MSAAAAIEAPVVECPACHQHARVQWQQPLVPTQPGRWQFECVNAACDEWMMTHYRTDDELANE